MSVGEIEPGKPIALIDLGDTLADCTPALHKQLDSLWRPGESKEDLKRVPLPPYLEARRREVMSVPGFWRGLARREPGFELLALLRREGFSVNVITKGPYNAPQVWADKVAWCRHHLPDVPVIVTDDKARVHGHLLVDDWLPYVEQWQRQWSSALAIVPAQPWNIDLPSSERCIRADASNSDAVIDAIRQWRKILGQL